MSITSTALKAYANASMQSLQKGESGPEKNGDTPQEVQRSFQDTIKDSLAKVNELQEDKSQMIKEFAAGKEQNVQDLMVALQKASLAMKMTTAVRSKALESYKTIMKMPM